MVPIQQSARVVFVLEREQPRVAHAPVRPLPVRIVVIGLVPVAAAIRRAVGPDVRERAQELLADTTLDAASLGK